MSFFGSFVVDMVKEQMDIEKEKDKVDHPNHYNARGDKCDDGTSEFEVIKIIEALGLAPQFCLANAIKYILRSKFKKGNRDIECAVWYLKRANKKKFLEILRYRDTFPSTSCYHTPFIENWKRISDIYKLDPALNNSLFYIWSYQFSKAIIELENYLILSKNRAEKKLAKPKQKPKTCWQAHRWFAK